jgi:hypothetical protein
VDLYTPVTPDCAKGKNRFTGKINRVTIDLKKMSPRAAEENDKVKAESK